MSLLPTRIIRSFSANKLHAWQEEASIVAVDNSKEKSTPYLLDKSLTALIEVASVTTIMRMLEKFP